MPSNAVKEGRTQANQLAQWMTMFTDLSKMFTGPSADAFKAFLSGQGMENFDQVLSQLQSFQNALPGLMQPGGMSPEIRDLFLSSVVQGQERAGEIVNNQGRTNRSDFLFDRLTDMATMGQPTVRSTAEGILSRGGQTTNTQGMMEVVNEILGQRGSNAALDDAGKIASQLISTGGRTADTAKALQTFQGVLDRGGRDAGTDMLAKQGQRLLDTQGFTPQTSRLMDQVMSVIQQGGMTPESRQLFGKVMDIVNAGGAGGALLPIDQVTSMARDAAATANAGRAEAARRSALQRGGSALFSGSAESAFQEFADEGMRAEAQAVREALLGQQGLQLDQLKAAFGTGADITRSAQGTMSSFAGVGGDIARSAAQNVQTGAGLLSDSERVAAERFGIGASGLNNTFTQELGRLQTGTNLFGDVQNTIMNRLMGAFDTGAKLEGVTTSNMGQALQALQNELNSRIGAGEGATRLFQTETARELEGLGTLLNAGRLGTDMTFGGQQLDLDRAKTQISAQLEAMGIESNLANAIAGNFLTAAGGLGNLGGQYSNQIGNAISGFSNVSGQLINAAAQPGFWSRLAQTAVGGLAGGVTGGLGEMLMNSFTPSTRVSSPGLQLPRDPASAMKPGELTLSGVPSLYTDSKFRS